MRLFASKQTSQLVIILNISQIQLTPDFCFNVASNRMRDFTQGDAATMVGSGRLFDRRCVWFTGRVRSLLGLSSPSRDQVVLILFSSGLINQAGGRRLKKTTTLYRLENQPASPELCFYNFPNFLNLKKTLMAAFESLIRISLSKLSKSNSNCIDLKMDCLRINLTQL